MPRKRREEYTDLPEAEADVEGTPTSAAAEKKKEGGKKTSKLRKVIKYGAIIAGIVTLALVVHEAVATGHRSRTTLEEDRKRAADAVAQGKKGYKDLLDILFYYEEGPNSELEKKKALKALIKEFGAPGPLKFLSIPFKVALESIPQGKENGLIPELKAQFAKIHPTQITPVALLLIQLINDREVTTEELMTILDLVDLIPSKARPYIATVKQIIAGGYLGNVKLS